MKKNLVLLLLLLVSHVALSQIDPAIEAKIDSLFIEWNRPNHPGGTVGVMQNGTIVYSKAFGLASLEYLVPNFTSTRFNIASVSKQFTSMAVLKLQGEGKLSIDDDIRKYIPELPDFGYKITFRHMMHHTSGMRSLHMMLAIAGWRDDDTRTNKDLLRFMTKQRELNFVPGTEYMYCNTGYILMGIAVERITGEKLPVWMKKEIFSPLGMYDTYLEDVYNRVVPGNATSYNGSYDKGFMREVEYWGYTGSGNIHSTTADLLKWYRYYYAPPDGWEELFTLMLTADTLNNGTPNNYAFGVIVDRYQGENRISHSGSIGGFRAYGCTFPDRQTEIVILTNFSSSGTAESVNRISGILLGLPLPGRPNQETEEKPDSDKYIPSEKELQSIAGVYWSPELETQYSFKVVDGKIEGYHNRHGVFIIEPEEKDIFTSESGFISQLKIVRNKKGIVTGMRVSNSRVKNLLMEKR